MPNSAFSPRLTTSRCVLLHVHQDMTEAATCDLRYDLAGFAGCAKVQPFKHEGVMRDAGMGFDQDKSSKSVARNALENELRLKRATAPALRHCFVQQCLAGRADEAAPLLGDTVLLTCMGEDLRAQLSTEHQVHEELLKSLEADLRDGGADEELVEASLEYSAWFK